MKKNLLVILILGMAVLSIQSFAHKHSEESKLSASDSLMQIEMSKHQQMEAVNAFPNYHPLVIHFPIVLLIMALVFQLLSLFIYKSEFSVAALILLALGVISAWLANNTFHAMPGELTGQAKEIFSTHEQMATLTWWFSFVALILKLVSMYFIKNRRGLEIIVSLLLLASSVTVSIAGHHGAMLVHMEGIGPMGKYLESYRPNLKTVETTSPVSEISLQEKNKEEGSGEVQEEDHHVGELGKGPHGGTIEEADPYHMEIVTDDNILVFYLLDGDAKQLDMKEVTGVVKFQYTDKSTNKINLILLNNRLTAMNTHNEKSFTANCTLKKDGKSYTASFNSSKDLPTNK